MKNNRKDTPSKDKRIWFFIIALSIGIIVFWTAAAITDWESTKSSIFRWENWFFMDWFGELHRIQTGVYTGDDIANYPAFCFLIFRIFYAFIPKPQGVVYDDFSIRTSQAAVVPFAIFMVIFIFIFYYIFRYQMREKTFIERELVAITLLLSAPFVYVFERGNLIIISLAFTFLYIMLYDSEKKPYRILSYICLAVAAAIKLYPAVFGILTLLRKRYKETILLIVLGLLFFIVPFFFFGGLESCGAFLNSIFGSFETYHDYGFGYDFSIYNLERLILTLCFGYTETATNISRGIILIILILSFLCVKHLWQKLCVLSLFIILIPTFSYYYTICFLVLPLLYLFQCKEKKIHYLYITEFLFIFFHWLYFPIDKANFAAGEELSHLIGWGHIMVYIGILALVLTLFIDGICQRIKVLRKNSVKTKMVWEKRTC